MRRYLKRFSDQGLLNTTRARNAQEECRKIKGIGKIVTQVKQFIFLNTHVKSYRIARQLLDGSVNM